MASTPKIAAGKTGLPASAKGSGKAGPPAPGRTTPGPFPKKGLLYGTDPNAPGGINYTSGPQKGRNGVAYAQNPLAPGGTQHTTGPLVRPFLPRHVSGSAQVNKDLLNFLTGGGNKRPKAVLPPTTDKKTVSPPTPPPVTTSSVPPVQAPSLPGLPGAATYNPVAPPPLYRPVATPQLDPYRGQTAAQAAQAQLDPQYAALDQQSQANQAALTGFTQSVLAALKGLPDATGQAYTQAQNVTDALASKGADLLSGANPNGADQSILQAINAPGSQQAAIADQLQKTFGGGAGVLYNQAGVNAGSALAAQKAAALAYANAQPGIQGLAATQAERNLLYQDAQQKAAIAAQFPSLENQVAAAKANALYNESQFTASQRSAANTSAANRASFNANQNAAVTDNALKKAAYNQNSAALGIKTQAAEAKTLPAPNTSWTRINGYRSDQYGNPILVNGKPVPNPGYKLNKAGTGVVKIGSASQGRPITSSEARRLYEGVSNMQSGFTDAKGKPHPAIDYNAAIRELQKEGYFRNPTLAAEARKALNTAYGVPVKIDFGNGTSTITVPGNPPITGPGSPT